MIYVSRFLWEKLPGLNSFDPRPGEGARLGSSCREGTRRANGGPRAQVQTGGRGKGAGTMSRAGCGPRLTHLTLRRDTFGYFVPAVGGSFWVLLQCQLQKFLLSLSPWLLRGVASLPPLALLVAGRGLLRVLEVLLPPAAEPLLGLRQPGRPPPPRAALRPVAVLALGVRGALGTCSLRDDAVGQGHRGPDGPGKRGGRSEFGQSDHSCARAQGARSSQATGR